MEDVTEAKPETIGDYPKELVQFLREGPRLLVVKGRSKVGKTLFALGLAEAVATPMNTFVINTRMLDSKVYESFPWLKTNEARDKALEVQPAAMAPPRRPGPERPVPPQPESEAKIRSAREMLRGILGEVPAGPPPVLEKERPEATLEDQAAPGPDLSNLRQAIGDRNPKELLRVYRGLDGIRGGSLAVLVDRADRLSERYESSLHKLVLALRNDIVVARKAILVLVLEKPVNTVDDLADGIISLKESGGGGEFLGQLEMARLGELRIKHPKWMYNLAGGRFQVLKGIRVWG